MCVCLRRVCVCVCSSMSVCVCIFLIHDKYVNMFFIHSKTFVRVCKSCVMQFLVELGVYTHIQIRNMAEVQCNQPIFLSNLFYYLSIKDIINTNLHSCIYRIYSHES